MWKPAAMRLGIIPAIALGVGLLAGGCGGPSASYDAKITQVMSRGAQQMGVLVKVTNNGSTAGKPGACVVSLYDTGDRKVGSNLGWTLRRPLKPGASVTVGVVVDVAPESQSLVSVGQSVAAC